MSIDKFGRHLQHRHAELIEEHETVRNKLLEYYVDIKLRDIKYKTLVTFYSSKFADDCKNFLIFNVKQHYEFPYDEAIIESINGHPQDIEVIINEKTYKITDLVGVELRRMDSIAFREKSIQSDNTTLLLDFMLLIPYKTAIKHIHI